MYCLNIGFTNKNENRGMFTREYVMILIGFVDNDHSFSQQELGDKTWNVCPTIQMKQPSKGGSQVSGCRTLHHEGPEHDQILSNFLWEADVSRNCPESGNVRDVMQNMIQATSIGIRPM